MEERNRFRSSGVVGQVQRREQATVIAAPDPAALAVDHLAVDDGPESLNAPADDDAAVTDLGPQFREAASVEDDLLLRNT